MTFLTLKAASIGSPIAGLMSTPQEGNVIATFARSCYVELGGRIAALVAPDLLNGPLNLVLAQLPENALARLTPADPVRISAGDLHVADVLRVDLQNVSVWNARLCSLPRVEPAFLRSQLGVVKTVLSGAPVESLAHSSSRPARASEGMDALYSALRHYDEAALEVGVDRLVGLGAGLTPSGDDVLAGMLIALHLIRPSDAEHIGRLVVRIVRGRTTKISQAYLEAAAGGNAGEAWHDLARQLERGSGGVRTASQRVMAFGETSGADMLTGFVLAAEGLLAEGLLA